MLPGKFDSVRLAKSLHIRHHRPEWCRAPSSIDLTIIDIQGTTGISDEEIADPGAFLVSAGFAPSLDRLLDGSLPAPVEHGRSAFDTAGCATCHRGEALTAAASTTSAPASTLEKHVVERSTLLHY